MKIAALYDIHGNLPALQAVLAELAEVQPDVIVVGGDIITGPMPAQTLEMLTQLRTPVRSLRGNCDREVVTVYDNDPAADKLSESSRIELQWEAKQLTREQRDFLANLPERIEMQVEGLGNVLFCHATPHNDEDIFTALTPVEQLESIFSGITHDLVVCGHTHIQHEWQVGDVRVVNAGSVGMPYAGKTGAFWLLLSPTGYEYRWTNYDVEATAEEIKLSGNPQAIQFAEENVLKVPTEEEANDFFEKFAEAKRKK